MTTPTPEALRFFRYTNAMPATTAETAMAPAAATTTMPETIVPDYAMAIIGVGIAVIIAVAISTLLILRKK